MSRADRAEELFRQGCNCSQSVFVAFSDVLGMDEKAALRLSSTFGGGMGKLREVCGAVTGAFMVLGVLYGYDDVTSQEEKVRTYKMVQDFAADYKKEKGTIICRELLGLKEGEDLPEPAIRTEEYYQTRPCIGACRYAAELVERIMKEKIQTNNGDFLQ